MPQTNIPCAPTLSIADGSTTVDHRVAPPALTEHNEIIQAKPMTDAPVIASESGSHPPCELPSCWSQVTNSRLDSPNNRFSCQFNEDIELLDLFEELTDDELDDAYPISSFDSNNISYYHGLLRVLDEVTTVNAELASLEAWPCICCASIGDILALAHFTGGQPARGTELLTLQWGNAGLQPRNIYHLTGPKNPQALQTL